MYKYHYVEVAHSVWTGKPKENIRDIIDYYAAGGWRLVQVLESVSMSSGAKTSTIIFEKPIDGSEKSYDLNIDEIDGLV